MQLSEQQILFFNTFGFLVFRQHLSAEELARLNPEFNAAIDALLPPGVQSKERVGRLFLDADTPLLSGLGDDSRFADVAEQVLGRVDELRKEDIYRDEMNKCYKHLG